MTVDQQNIARKVYQKVFNRVIDKIHHLDKRMDQLESSLHENTELLLEQQLKVNHNLSERITEINDRTKNSGTVVLSSKEMISKIFSGLKIYLDPRDLAVSLHLALDAVWEHRITAAWLAVVKDDDIVVDIGANFGYFGVLAAQKTDKKRSKVIFFEANKNLIPYVQKTLNINWLNEQCVIENLAIGNRKEKLTLHVLKDYLGSSSVQSMQEVNRYMGNKMPLELAEDIQVDAVTLDEYCKENKIETVNLIKMDIEGFEDKAYAGMRKIIKKSPDVTLFIEFTKEAYKEPEAFFMQMLEDFGNVYIINEEGYILKPARNNYANVVGNSDDWTMPIFSKNPNLANKVE
jgi:FkbM family methyltransferase